MREARLAGRAASLIVTTIRRRADRKIGRKAHPTMSFANAAIPAAKAAIGTGSRILRGATIAEMGRAVGVVVSAGVLAATYQLMLDESRNLLRGYSIRRNFRQRRKEALLVTTLGSGLDVAVQDRLLLAKDPFHEGLLILADPDVATRDRETVRNAMKDICGQDVTC